MDEKVSRTNLALQDTPRWDLAARDAELMFPEAASTHGSPWRYDTFVPVIFAGNGLAAKTVFRKVQTVDIALTLSKYLKIKAPSGATGSPLTEVLDQ